MKVLFAYYGVRCVRGPLRKSNQLRSTSFAKSRCNGRSFCKGVVNNHVLTDPYGGCPKNFIVVAKCANGKIIADLVHHEGQYFHLNCYYHY